MPSVEWPSTKISSLLVPRLGVSSTIRSIIPASFFAGTTIETDSSSGSSGGIGRATIHQVRHSWRMIQKPARIPFRNVERSGICSGRRIRRVAVTGSSPFSWSRFLTSSLVIQLRTGVRALRWSSSSSASSGRQSWL